jgi:drug/metabolite transporter (DMT)-like permease
VRDSLIGLLLAALASCCFNLAIVIQAAEARAVPQQHDGGMSLSLIGRLLQRPRWLAGLALSFLAIPLQTVALMLAPITLVQPADAVGLVVLLIAGVKMLHEPVGRREILSVAAIFVGVMGVVLAGVEHTDSHAPTRVLLMVLIPLALIALIPYMVRGRVPSIVMVLGAGLTFALGAFALKLIADALSAGHWLSVLAWGTAAALFSILGVNGEMSALQRLPVARVAPVIFAVELIVPVILGPLIGGETWPSDAPQLALLLGSLALTVGGAAVLMTSGPVSGVLAAEHAHDVPAAEPLAA